MMNETVDNNSAIKKKPSNNTSNISATRASFEPANGDHHPAKFCQEDRISYSLYDQEDDDDDDDGDGKDVSALNPQSFLSEGNKHFINKRFICAIKSYSQGLKRLEVKKKWEEEDEDGNCASSENTPIKPDNNRDTNNVDDEKKKKKKSLLLGKDFSFTNADISVALDLLCNRALVYNSIGNYAAALGDTKRVLFVSPTHFKAILRQAKALAGLAQYQDAINCVNSFLKHFSNSKNNNSNPNKAGSTKEEKLQKEYQKELLLYLEKLKWQKEQSETGEFYDAPLIMDQPFEPAPADWVEYYGPIAVESFPGKGRGLIAVEDLPPSTLVLACRVFEIIFLDGKSNPEDLLSEESKKALNSGKIKLEEDVTLNLLARKVYDRLKQNPEKRADFYRLHAGNELGSIESPSAPTSKPLPLDMARIYGICRTNTFANAGDSYPETEKSVGIWLFPAFINHLCIGGNCTWKIFGDFIFVRTYKEVKKGEELIHSYVSPSYPLKARMELLTNRLEFVCTCVLCELDRSLPPSIHEEKDKLRRLALNQEVKFNQIDPSEQDTPGFAIKQVQASILLLEQIITKLEKIQPQHGNYNASLLDPLQKLGLKYFGVGELQKTVKVMERAVSLMKICMLPHGVADCTLWILAAYIQMGNVKQAKKWGKTLRDNLLLAFGDTQVLQKLGPWAMEPMNEWGYL